MSDDHPTTRAASDQSARPVKPAKPRPDFPLFPHAAGVWAKKIRGKLHYFGSWSDPDGALAKYLAEKDDLHAGRTPRPAPDAVTVKDACNAFLTAKQQLVDTGELSPRTWLDYKDAADQVVSAFGKGRLVADLRPADFAALRNRVAEKWGVHRLAKTIQCVRSLFKHAYDAELIAQPVRFGPGFKRPGKKTFRLHRASQGPKVFTAEELRRVLAAANVQLRAMLLLGVNCGFGNADVGTLPLSALNLDGGWADFPRPKTGLPRRCPLWPETVAALRGALARRTEPKKAEHAGLVFITSRRGCWHTRTNDSPLSRAVWKLLKTLGINGHRNFYTLRHTFRTVADGAKDQPAADYIMGHEVAHMSSVYREGIDDIRLQAVTDHVRDWLFPPDLRNPQGQAPVVGVAQEEGQSGAGSSGPVG
jgi:integrase